MPTVMKSTPGNVPDIVLTQITAKSIRRRTGTSSGRTTESINAKDVERKKTMSHEEYLDIRGLMAQRGTQEGQLKRIPVVLVSKAKADHMDVVEARMRKVQMIAPFIILLLGIISGAKIF